MLKRRFAKLAFLGALLTVAFSAGRVSAGGPAPSWTFVKDPQGVVWLVINDSLIHVPYFPVPEDQWDRFEKTNFWAIPESNGVGYGPCPSWYQHVCNPFGDVRGTVVDGVLQVVEEDDSQPVPGIVPRDNVPVIEIAATPTRVPPTPTRPSATRR